MLLLLLLLLQWRVTTCASSPTVEDNMLPTDEEVIADIINSYRGQPEQEITLNLPTDEQAFNEIKPILEFGTPIYYTQSGTGHFVSSSFPEIDSRGFHESVFDNMDYYLPLMNRNKRYESPVSFSARDFNGDLFTEGFGSFQPVKRYYKNENTDQLIRKLLEKSLLNNKRQKRWTSTADADVNSETQPAHTVDDDWKDATSEYWTITKSNERNSTTKSSPDAKRDNSSSSRAGDTRRIKRNVYLSQPVIRRAADAFTDADAFYRIVRRPSMVETGFHDDVFYGGFGNFETLRKRVPSTDANDFDGDLGRLGPVRTRPSLRTSDARYRRKQPMNVFSGDAFHQDFGAFSTLKRRPDATTANADPFYTNFGNFETLRKRDRDFGYAAVAAKRKPYAAIELNGDAFHSNFGNFETLRKRDSRDGYVLSFDRVAAAKRKPSAAGELNGDAFHSNFGNFDTMKRNQLQTGFSGDAFHNNFGHFETLKRDLGGRLRKRRPEMDATGFNGDVFHAQFGNFDTLKKRASEMTAAGFHGDVFTGGFGSFDASKRDAVYDGLRGDANKREHLKSLFDSYGYTSEAESRLDLKNIGSASHANSSSFKNNSTN